MKKINFIRNLSSILLCFFITAQPYVFAFSQDAKIDNVGPWVWIVYGVIMGSFIWLFIISHKKNK